MTALEVGLLDSLAWRADGQLRVALHLPGVSPEDAAEVRFRAGERRVRRPATVAAAASGAMVEVAVPAPRLAGGLWRIAVRVGDAEAFTRVEARLLVHRGQPVALIAGPEPRTRMPAPDPRRISSSAPPAHRLSARVRDAIWHLGRR